MTHKDVGNKISRYAFRQKDGFGFYNLKERDNLLAEAKRNFQNAKEAADNAYKRLLSLEHSIEYVTVPNIHFAAGYFISNVIFIDGKPGTIYMVPSNQFAVFKTGHIFHSQKDILFCVSEDFSFLILYEFSHVESTTESGEVFEKACFKQTGKYLILSTQEIVDELPKPPPPEEPASDSPSARLPTGWELDLAEMGCEPLVSSGQNPSR